MPCRSYPLTPPAARRTAALTLLAALPALSACGPSFLSQPLQCNDIRKLCFRGVHVDPTQTRSRYGIDGQDAIYEYDGNLFGRDR